MIDLNDNSKTITQLKDNGAKVFEAVYKYYFAPLYSFASQYVDGPYAEGVVQETMLWLWENRLTLIPEMSLKSLLFTIVKNKCLNHLRREQTKSEIYNSIRDRYKEEFEDPDFYLERELMTLYEDAMSRLSPNFRAAFELSRSAGLTHKEIAEKLQVSVQTVNYRISNALEFLRKELKDYLPLILVLLSGKTH